MRFERGMGGWRMVEESAMVLVVGCGLFFETNLVVLYSLEIGREGLRKTVCAIQELCELFRSSGFSFLVLEAYSN